MATRLAAAVAVGFVLWFLPAPSGVSLDGNYYADGASAPQGAVGLAAAWHVFAVFAAAIVAFLLRPLPMGAVTLIALTVLAATGTVDFNAVLVGYSDSTVWLVVTAFLIAGAMVQTGLGRRVALTLVVRLGRTPRGLGYAICASEMVLGTLIPSNTARGGGVLFPITRSLAGALDSHPEKNPQRIGAFLMTVGAHANLIAAAMYLTGMAANPLVRRAALDVFGIDFGWGRWALGAIVPALISFVLLVQVAYRLERPTITGVAEARERARTDLAALGAWSTGEKIMAFVGLVLVVLWSTKAWHHMGTTQVALIGLCILLVTRVATWRSLIENAGAWDAMVWVGGILTMANHLRDTGFIGWFAHNVAESVSGLSGITVIVVLALVYFYSMYGFSMLTAHIAAMVAAFMAIAGTAGTPPLVAIALLAYFSDLCAALTPYSSGPIIIHFGAGYVSAHRWFRNGLVIALMHTAIWIPIGLLWWKLLGWW